MQIFQKKWVLAVLILVPNLLLSIVQTPTNLIFALGAGLGAATVVFLFFLICQSLLMRTRLKRRYLNPLSVVLGYAVYYLYLFVTSLFS